MTTRATCRGALATMLAVLAAVLATSTSAIAQSDPSKPIRWIVPYTPGGITDTVTRLMAQKISVALGQPVLIENRPGANSIIGADTIARTGKIGTATDFVSA